jgi:hypothetical protein
LLNNKGEALFEQLPAAIMDHPVHIHLSNLNGLPYQPVCDTCTFTISREKLVYLRLKRSGMDSLRGQVTANGYPVKGALITVQDQQLTLLKTDSFIDHARYKTGTAATGAGNERRLSLLEQLGQQSRLDPRSPGKIIAVKKIILLHFLLCCYGMRLHNWW